MLFAASFGFCLRLLMWISFERFQQANLQEQFALTLFPDWFAVHSRILSHLDPIDHFRFLQTCIWLLADRKDLCLFATGIRLQYEGSGFSVATPPVEPYPILGQVGAHPPTVWDLSTLSSDSEASSLAVAITVEESQNAVEEEHSDNFWSARE